MICFREAQIQAFEKMHMSAAKGERGCARLSSVLASDVMLQEVGKGGAGGRPATACEQQLSNRNRLPLRHTAHFVSCPSMEARYSPESTICRYFSAGASCAHITQAERDSTRLEAPSSACRNSRENTSY